MTSRQTAIGIGTLVTSVAALLFPSLIGLTVLSPFDQVFVIEPFASVRPSDFMRASNQTLIDVSYDITPYALEARDQILAGKLPLWNEFAGAGRPLLAWQQAAPFYPPNALAWVFPYFEAQAWIAAVKLLAAGLGVFFFGRALRLSPLAAAISALAYALSTYLVFWMEHPHLNAYALLPWMLLAANRIAIRADLAGGLLLALLIGLAWLGGHPPSTAIGLLAAGAFFLYRLLHRPSRSEGRLGGLTRGGLFIGAVLVGTAVGAIMLVPFVEHLLEAFDPARGGGKPSLSATLLGVFVVPEYWGRHDKGVVGQPNVFGKAAYIGVAPVLFAAASLSVRRSADKIFFAGLALVALVLVVRTPVAPVATVIRELPGLSAINLGRLMVVIVLCGALLAGFGVDDLVRGTERERRRMLVVMTAIAVLPVSLLLGPVEIAGPLRTVSQLPTIDGSGELGLARWAALVRWLLIAGAAVGIAFVVARRSRPAVVALTALVLLTAFDVVTMAYGMHPQVARARVSPPLPPTVQHLRDNLGAERFIALGEAMPPNLATRYRLRDARWGSGPHLERYRQLWARLGGSAPYAGPAARRGTRGRKARLGGPAPDARPAAPRGEGGGMRSSNARFLGNSNPLLADLTSSRYILQPKTVSSIAGRKREFSALGQSAPSAMKRQRPREVPVPVLGRVVASAPSTRPPRTPAGVPGSHFVVENPDALPRAWVAHSWVGVRGPEQATDAVAASDAGLLLRRPVLEGAPLAPTGPTPPPGRARIVGDRDANRVVVDAVAHQDGYLVLNDQYYPGWRATVDGKPAPILAANGAFRAVRLRPGEHEITFEYRPASVSVGIALTTLGLLTLAAGGTALALRARRLRVQARGQ